MSLQREASKSPKRRESFLVFFPLLTTTTALPGGEERRLSLQKLSYFLAFSASRKGILAFLRKKYRRIQQATPVFGMYWINRDKRSLPRNPLGPFLMQMEYFGRCGSIWMPCATAISEPGRQRGELSALDSRQQPLSLAEGRGQP